MRALVFAFAVAAAAACATSDGAQAQNGGQAAAAQSAGATRYILDPEHTQIGFAAERFGFNNVLARFDNVSGEVMLDQAHPERSSVTATVRISELSAGNPTRNEHLSGEHWLNAAQFPTMEFRSTSVQVTGENTAIVTGDLTLLGQTHPLTLNVTLNQIGTAPNNQLPSAGFSATGSLSRGTWGSTAAGALIGDTVTFTIEALGQAPAA